MERRILMKDQYFKCQCGCALLHMAYDPDCGLEVAMFEHNASHSIWNRIRLAWSALRGKPYTDMIILNEQQIADLAEYLFHVQNPD